MKQEPSKPPRRRVTAPRQGEPQGEISRRGRGRPAKAATPVAEPAPSACPVPCLAERRAKNDLRRGDPDPRRAEFIAQAKNSSIWPAGKEPLDVRASRLVQESREARLDEREGRRGQRRALEFAKVMVLDQNRPRVGADPLDGLTESELQRLREWFSLADGQPHPVYGDVVEDINRRLAALGERVS